MSTPGFSILRPGPRKPLKSYNNSSIPWLCGMLLFSLCVLFFVLFFLLGVDIFFGGHVVEEFERLIKGVQVGETGFDSQIKDRFAAR